MADELFPLPLTPFEYYYWCDDRPEYPTTFPLELLFRGPLRREPLEAAIRVCLDRHPLLAANLDTTTKFPQWIARQREVASARLARRFDAYRIYD